MNLDVAAKIVGSKIQIFVLYLFLLYYLGIIVIRNNVFDRTTDIWYEEVPRPEVMFIIIDGIEMARFQGDFLKEDLLFFFMLELLRNPEDLRSMTGSMFEHRFTQHRLNHT